MDVGLVFLSSAVYFASAHVSRKDARFFYWVLRDCEKAALSPEGFYLDWKGRRAIRMRLCSHMALLLVTAISCMTRSFSTMEILHSTTEYHGEAPAAWGWAALSCIARLADVASLNTTAMWKQITLACTVCLQTLALFTGPVAESVLLTSTPTFFSRDNVFYSDWLLMVNFFLSTCCEEIVFRWFHTYLLRRRCNAVQVVVSGIAFVVAHVPKFCYFLCDDIRCESSELAKRDGARRVNTEWSTATRDGDVPSSHRFTSTTATRHAGFDRLPAMRLSAVKKEIWELMWQQCAITFVFGTVVCLFFIFVYDQRVVPLIVMHCVCNVMGFPKFEFARYLSRRRAPCFYRALFVCLCYVAGVVSWCCTTYHSIKGKEVVF